MTLGDVIKKYRREHNMSQRQFAEKCKLSNGYIAMVERGKNPTTGKPIVPSIDKCFAIASAMGMSLTELFTAIDDTKIRVNLMHPNTLTSEQRNDVLDYAFHKAAHVEVARVYTPFGPTKAASKLLPSEQILRADVVPVKAGLKTDLTAEERSLLEAFRAADDRAKDDAYKMLLDHPKYN